MLHLRTFGGLGIERDGRALAGGGARRRLATLLAYVAAHGAVGVARESVLADFWPESDETHARNSLKQAVFAMRREFGESVLVSAGGALRIDEERLTVDALAFTAALDRDDLERAVALYRGTFLDGVALPGLPHLERWVDAERERFALDCARALDVLADRASAQGRHADCTALRRRRATMDPLSGQATAALMRALRDAGDRTAALDVWRAHAAAVRAQLGATPDPAVASLAEELRHALAAQRSERAVDPVPRRLLSSGERRARPARRPWWHVRAGFLARVSLVALMGTTLPPAMIRLAAASTVRHQEPAVATSLIAVLPFAVRGHAAAPPLADARFGEGVAELLSLALHGAGPWRTVPASALLADEEVASSPVLTSARVRAVTRRFGAGSYVLGDVVADGDRLHLAVSMHDTHGRVLAQAAAETRAGRVGDAAAEIVRALLAQRLASPAERLAREAVGATSSLDALKAWLTGETAFREHRYEDAATAFAQAAVADPQFALALYRLADAADRLGEPARADSAAARATMLAERLPEAERALLAARHVAHAGRIADAERRYEALLDDAPDHAEAWFRLGELRFHANPSRGRPVSEARIAFERALALEPQHVEAMIYLARIASQEGRATDADSLTALARTASRTGGARP